MIRILVVSRYGHLASTRPEAEIYLALHQRGFTITIVTDKESEYVTRFRESGIKVLIGHPEQRRDAAATRIIHDELLRQPYNVLMLYNSRAIANGIRAASGIDIKVVAYRGNAANMQWYDPSNYLKLYHPRIDAILCNSTGVQTAIRRNRWWARRDITVCINKGHNLAWYADVKPVPRGALGIPADAFVVVCVANASRVKGVPVLLEALGLLDPSLLVHTVLVGRNMDTPQHQALIAALPFPERVHLTGYRADVLGIVAAADLKVLPSRYGESLTKAVVEAMAVGTPALISDLPGNADLFEHGDAGWKFPPGDAAALADAIAYLHQQPSLRQNLARRAQERLAGELSHAATVEAMEDFFTTLASEPASR